MIGYSDATTITAIVAAFFVVLALIVVGRSLFTRHQRGPRSRSFRVGVFVERDLRTTQAAVHDDYEVGREAQADEYERNGPEIERDLPERGQEAPGKPAGEE